MDDLERIGDIWQATAAVLCGMIVVTLLLYNWDGRLIGRESVWVKPLKFEASLALHFATLAIALKVIDPASKAASWLWWICIASVASTVFEMAYIVIQAARQQASHFNLANAFYQTMYVLMAAGAVFITLAAAAVGLAAIIHGDREVSLVLRAGIAIGLIGGALLTLVTAFRMGGALDRHAGLEAATAIRMSFTGWSLTVGDRRVPHFFATHMMQAVPVAAFVLDKAVSARAGIAGVSFVSVLWVAATLVTFRQANLGLPLTEWPWK